MPTITSTRDFIVPQPHMGWWPKPTDLPPEIVRAYANERFNVPNMRIVEHEGYFLVGDEVHIRFAVPKAEFPSWLSQLLVETNALREQALANYQANLNLNLDLGLNLDITL